MRQAAPARCGLPHEAYFAVLSGTVPMKARSDSECAALSTPPPPLMTWEAYENGKHGQLNLPGFTEMPTLAERAFLLIARAWRSSIRSPQAKTKAQGAREETALLSCLLLATRWGRTFTPLPLDEIWQNRYTHRQDNHFQWLDDLAWDLCTYSLSDETERLRRNPTIETLIANLSHESSSVRAWTLDLAWSAHGEIPALYARQALNELLQNVAVYCCDSSAALASRFFLKPDDFLEYARQYRPPSDYQQQYARNMDRLAGVLRLSNQAFAKTESDCWSLIAGELFASFFVPHRLPPAFTGHDLFEHLKRLSSPKTL